MTREIAVAKPERRVREHVEVTKILRREISASQPQVTRRSGKYIQAIDSALPDKHRIRLYGTFSHERMLASFRKHKRETLTQTDSWHVSNESKAQIALAGVVPNP